MKHINFSKGQFFLDDLKTVNENELEFSYNLGQGLKIDIERAKAT